MNGKQEFCCTGASLVFESRAACLAWESIEVLVFESRKYVLGFGIGTCLVSEGGSDLSGMTRKWTAWVCDGEEVTDELR